MSLERDITAIMEDLFKPASKEDLKQRRASAPKEYALWIGSYFDGVLINKETAIRYAKEHNMEFASNSASVWEVPAGWSILTSREKGVQVYPVKT